MSRWSRPALWMVVGLIAIGVAGEASARVGGGQGFGGGGGGFSGGGGGDGDGLALIVWFLIRLCIEYPQVGVPLLILFLIFIAVRAWIQSRDHARQVHRVRRALDPSMVNAHRDRATGRRTDPIAKLAEQDEGLSEPVLYEFLQLVHRRALEAHGTGEWATLAPFVGPEVPRKLTEQLPGVTAIRDVVHAGISVTDMSTAAGETEITVRLIGSRVEVLADRSQPMYVEERWRFARSAGAQSLEPEAALRLGCPSCGSAVDTDNMGACTFCGTPIAKGQLQWQARTVITLVRHEMVPPTVSRTRGGDEPGVHVPTVVDPELSASWRAFTTGHPDFDQAAFLARVKQTFMALQQSWSEGRWEGARPHVTGPLFDNLRFSMDAYGAHGLRNRVEDVQTERIEVVKVGQDAWYDAITVRLWASAKDWVEDRDGKVVGGNASVRRRFSEYWTFLRATGSGASAGDGVHCPSCGALLDNVSQQGICGYCESRITTGRFDWVLSRIDQPQAYQG